MVILLLLSLPLVGVDLAGPPSGGEEEEDHKRQEHWYVVVVTGGREGREGGRGRGGRRGREGGRGGEREGYSNDLLASVYHRRTCPPPPRHVPPVEYS